MHIYKNMAGQAADLREYYSGNTWPQQAYFFDLLVILF